jgi:hypothetical protein
VSELEDFFILARGARFSMLLLALFPHRPGVGVAPLLSPASAAKYIA